MSSKVSPGQGWSIRPNGNVNTKILRKTANAGKFASIGGYELTGLEISVPLNAKIINPKVL